MSSLTPLTRLQDELACSANSPPGWARLHDHSLPGWARVCSALLPPEWAQLFVPLSCLQNELAQSFRSIPSIFKLVILQCCQTTINNCDTLSMWTINSQSWNNSPALLSLNSLKRLNPNIRHHNFLFTMQYSRCHSGDLVSLPRPIVSKTEFENTQKCYNWEKIKQTVILVSFSQSTISWLK